MIIYNPKEIFKTKNEFLLAVLRKTAGLNLFLTLFLGLTVLYPPLVFLIEGEFREGPLSLIFFGYFFLGASFIVIALSRIFQAALDWDKIIHINLDSLEVHSADGKKTLNMGDLVTWRKKKSFCSVSFRKPGGFGYIYFVFPKEIPTSFTDFVVENYSKSCRLRGF